MTGSNQHIFQGGSKTNIALSGLIISSLIDNDGSEQGFITLHGLPEGTLLLSQANPAGIASSNGSVTFNIAELETEDAVPEAELPPWLDREVTDDPAFYNVSLALNGMPEQV